MGARLHTIRKYEIQYGSTFSHEDENRLFSFLYDKMDSEDRWVSYDEDEIEISLSAIDDILNDKYPSDDAPEIADDEVKRILRVIAEESDKSNDFARLELF